jgi:hypothetical protein
MRFHLITRDVERANLVREFRLRTLFLAARSVEHLSGDVAELGVYKGRSALLLARALPKKALHLFDTFVGMPDCADPAVDGHAAGQFTDCSFEETSKRLLPHTNTVFHRGVFPATVGPVSDRTFSMAHFDGDLYKSCADFISFFWPRLVSGGVLVFDDYDWPLCAGVRKAIEEAGLDVSEAVDYQAMVWKP